MPTVMDALLHPRSIAVIGASPDANKLNGRPYHYLIRDGFPGPVYPVNPKYAEIKGRPCYASIAALPETPDLAVIVVAARFVEDAVRELGKRGTTVAIIISSGYGETGPEGRALEQQLMATARANKIRICGPNTLGQICAFDKVTVTFSQYAYNTPQPGPIAFVSQSGALGSGIAHMARARGLNLGYFVTTGNQADIHVMEILEDIATDVRIKVLTCYIEGLRPGDGAALVRLADSAIGAGKPLILSKVGRRASGARAAASHTGSLAGEDRVFDGILRQHGVIRARHEEHMIDLTSALAHCPLPQGRGVAVVTQSGGAGVLMADHADDVGLDMPVLTAETQKRLKAILPGFASTSNPVDITGQFVAEPAMLRDSVKFVLDDPNVHCCVVWLQLMDGHADILVDVFRQIKASVTKPFIVCWLGCPEKASQLLAEAGICVIATTACAMDAAAGLADYADARHRFDTRQRECAALSSAAKPGAAPISAKPPRPVPSMTAAAALQAAGLPLVETAFAASADEAMRIAQRIDYPVALKIESPDLPHKTEAGGVVLGLSGCGAVHKAATGILADARAFKPDARIDGLLVQKMAPATVPMVLGIRRDPVFGPVVMAGMGGIFVEILDDVLFARAPVLPGDAADMLARLKGARLFDGARGAAPVDRAALVKTICDLSQFALAHPEIAELDLNPIFAGPDGVKIVDWLMLTDDGTLSTAEGA